MKKSLLLLGILLGACNASYAIKVTLPAEDVLSHRLFADFPRLVTDSNLANDLGGQEREIRWVISSVNRTIAAFIKGRPFPMYQIMEMKKAYLFELILQDDLAALTEARKLLASQTNPPEN